MVDLVLVLAQTRLLEGLPDGRLAFSFSRLHAALGRRPVTGWGGTLEQQELDLALRDFAVDQQAGGAGGPFRAGLPNPVTEVI